MKVYYSDAKRYLTPQNLPSTILITGDEPFLIDTCKTELLSVAKEKGFITPERFVYQTGFSWETLINAIQNRSLFSPKSCVCLHLPTGKCDAKGKETLVTLLKQLNENALFVITTPKLEAATQKQAWVKAIESDGLIIQVPLMKPEQFPAWIKQKASSLGVTLTPNQARLIAHHTEGNLMAAAQECEKLSLLTPPITDDMLNDMLSDNAQYSLFQCVDMALAGQSKGLLRMLITLKQQGAEPLLLLWAITKECRQAYRLLSDRQQGLPLSQSMQKHRIWSSRTALMQRYIKHHTIEACQAHLITCAHIDRLIKGVERGDIWQMCTKLLMDISTANI